MIGHSSTLIILGTWLLYHFQDKRITLPQSKLISEKIDAKVFISSFTEKNFKGVLIQVVSGLKIIIFIKKRKMCFYSCVIDYIFRGWIKQLLCHCRTESLGLPCKPASRVTRYLSLLNHPPPNRFAPSISRNYQLRILIFDKKDHRHWWRWYSPVLR